MLLWHRRARSHEVPLSLQPAWSEPGASPYARWASPLAQGPCALPRRPGRLCRLYRPVVLARRSLRSCRAAVWPGPCPLHAGHPGRPSHKRPERCADNRRAAARREAAPGLWLARREAGDSCCALAPRAAEASTRGATGPPPAYHQAGHVPERGKKLASKAHRDGVAARFPAPAVPNRGAVDRALRACSDPRRRDGAWPMGQTATPHDAQTCYRVPSVPGIGKLVRCVRRDAMPARTRFPRGQACVAYGRLGTWAREAAGKRSGTAGAQRGHRYRTWACAAAAVLVLRKQPGGQQDRARGEKTRQRPSVDPLSPYTGPGGVLQGQARPRLRQAPVGHR